MWRTAFKLTAERILVQNASMPVRTIGVNDTEWALVTTGVNEGGTADNSVPWCGIGVYFFAPILREANNLPSLCEGSINSGGADMRVKVTLACTECKQRNYVSKKNKKNDPDRLEMNKHCKFCRKHTLHKETK